MEVKIMIKANNNSHFITDDYIEKECENVISDKELPKRTVFGIFEWMDSNNIKEEDIVDIFCTFNNDNKKYYCDETLKKEFNLNPKLLNRKE